MTWSDCVDISLFGYLNCELSNVISAPGYFAVWDYCCCSLDRTNGVSDHCCCFANPIGDSDFVVVWLLNLYLVYDIPQFQCNGFLQLIKFQSVQVNAILQDWRGAILILLFRMVFIFKMLLLVKWFCPLKKVSCKFPFKSVQLYRFARSSNYYK